MSEKILLAECHAILEVLRPKWEPSSIVEGLLARIAAAIKSPQKNHWLPIESAPKTGEHFLAKIDGGIGFGICGGKSQDFSTVVHWASDGFYASYYGSEEQTPQKYTHWTPFPDERRKGIKSKSLWDRTERRKTAPFASEGKKP